MAKRLIPLLDRILVERIQPATKSAGGILLPELAVGKVNEGKVLAVGPGGRTKEGTPLPPSVAVGDKVLLPEFGGSKITLDAKEMYLYRNDELLGILKDD